MRRNKYHSRHLRVVENIRKRQWHRHIRRKSKKYIPHSITNMLLQEMCIVIGYHDLYYIKNDILPIIKELLTEIPVAGALNTINKIHKLVMYMTTNWSTQNELTKMVISYLEQDAQKKYYSLKKQIAKQKNRGLLFTNNISELLLSYYVIQYGNKSCPQMELDYQQQRNLYKAMLCCNDIYTNEFLHINDCNSIIKTYGIEGFEIKLDLPISEYKRDKQIVEPIYKAFAFFRYCEQDSFWKQRVDKLYKSKNATCWQEYIEMIIGIIKTYMIDLTKNAIDVTNFNCVAEFMEYYCVRNTPSIANTEEHTSIPQAINFLRTQFFWKWHEGIFIPLNHNLLINLIYQSIKFDLLKIMENERNDLIEQFKKEGTLFPELEKKDTRTILSYIKSCLKDQGKPISKENEKIIYRSYFLGLNSEFGQNFSQQYILEPLMKLAFDGHGILLKEEDMKTCVKAPSDYYIRIEDTLYLFELKDTYLNDDVKFSQNIHTVLYGDKEKSEGIMDKLCKDGTSGRKGVPQLLNSIVQIINNKKLDSIDPKASFVRNIYPILITTDMAFSANGVNAFIIKKYKKDLRKHYPVDDKVNVHMPTIINIDFFIRYNEMLFNRKISLQRTLNQYHTSKVYKMTSFDAFAFDLYKNIYNSEACIKHLNINPQ